MEVKVANLPRKAEDRSDNGREFESQLWACLIYSSSSFIYNSTSSVISQLAGASGCKALVVGVPERNVSYNLPGVDVVLDTKF